MWPAHGRYEWDMRGVITTFAGNNVYRLSRA
jgi:hypothetical protein